ncbi:MAG TPA: LysR family transcriptional regulator [Piscirickettsiaceae bacterium]|nr:LysR family transcriptional regulator [Piscirickettsiaceae bacterium]HIQ40597.1 LysR family transcriptional regulator [Sulfurivirga caldicuralii]
MLNVIQAELLVALEAEQLNLTRAATRLHMVQPAATRQLKLLEQHLETPVFVREGKRLKGWTTVGEQVLQQAHMMVAARRNVRALADSLKSGEEELFLGTTHTQAKYFLPARLKRFRRHFPKVRLHIEQSHPQALVQMLKRGEIDLALCTEAITRHSGLQIRSCYNWHYVLVCPRTHPLSRKTSIEWSDLATYPLLTYNRGFSGGKMLESCLATAGLQPDFVLRAADTDVIKTYVREGFGIGIIACQSYRQSEDDDLVCHNLSHLLPQQETVLAWLQHRYVSPAMGALIEELSDDNG